MEKFNLLKYTQEIIKELDNKNLYITHLNIAYKVISFYEANNKTISNDELITLVEKVYEIYTDDDNSDVLDEIIEKIIK